MPNITLAKLRSRTTSWSKAAESPAAPAAGESAAHAIASTEDETVVESETATTGAQAMLSEDLSTDASEIEECPEVVFHYLGPGRGHSYRL